jgi:protein SCO1/2
MLAKLLFLTFLLLNQLFSSTINNEKQIGIYEQLGKTIPLDTIFTDEYQQTNKLQHFLENKPTVLTLNYFSCPSLCSPLLISVAKTLNKLQLRPYLDYKVITISINPQDTYKTALEKKETTLSVIKKAFPPQTWSFLTSNQLNIDAITNAVGFKYETREKEGVIDYLHPAAIIVISPNGKITRYLNGIEFLPFDLKLAILEASQEKTGPTIAKTLLYCFAYDPQSKRYIFQAEKIVGIVILLIIFIFFIYLIKTGKKNKGKKDA